MDRLKTIATFVQIAKFRSLSKAADELGVSRALASAHLKQLEQHLGVRLVNRTTRRLAITDAGAEYLAFCTRLLDSFEAEEARISHLQTEPQGHLKIMASMAFGHSQLAPIVTSFTNLHRGVKISLMVSDRSFSPSDFVEGGYDLGISMHMIKDASIVSSKVADGAWIACASARYCEEHPAIRRPNDLVGHNCLVHRSHAPDSVWRFNSSSKSYAVAVSGSLFTNSSMVLRAAILADSGVAMLPVYAVGEDMETGRLRQVLGAFSSDTRPIYIVYPHSRYLPKRTRLFVDFMRQSLKGRAL
jgi:DNA-binding transcriptional LysR family regulator